MDITKILHKGRLGSLKDLISQDPDLLGYKDELGNNLIMYAVFHSDIAMIDFLVQNGVKIDESNHDHLTPLITSIISNKPNVSEHLIQLGADVNYHSDKYPLYWAWICKRVHTFKTLLDFKADPDALLTWLYYKHQNEESHLTDTHKLMLKLICKEYTVWHDIRGLIWVRHKCPNSIPYKLPYNLFREVASYL